MGGYGGDSAWLGNAKRQSLFRQSAGPISWAGKPNTPGMEAPLPATANQQSNQQFGQPVAAAPSLFTPSNAFGMTAEQSRSQAGSWDQHMGEMNAIREQMSRDAVDGDYQRRSMFANDTRTYQGRRLSDIFGGGFSGRPGTGSY